MSSSEEECESPNAAVRIEAILSGLERDFDVSAQTLDNTDAWVNRFMPFGDAPGTLDANELYERALSVCSDELIDSRKRRIDQVNRATAAVAMQIDCDEENIDRRAAQIPHEHAFRLGRCAELVFYAHQLQECKRRICDIVDPMYTCGSTSVKPGLLLKRFQPMGDDIKRTPYQELILHALRELNLKRYRRYRRSVYEEIRVRGHLTCAYRKVSSIKDWVWNSLDKELQNDVWMHATSSKGNIEALITHLENASEVEFAPLKKNRRIVAFRNGVLITAVYQDGKWKDHFEPHAETQSALLRDMLADGSVAVKFHNADYPDHVGDVDMSMADDLAPTLMKILRFQGWPEEVVEWMLAFIGRMLHPIAGLGALERWQCVAFLIGLGNTGKSTIVEHVVGQFFDSDDVFNVSNNPEKQFGWASAEGRLIWTASELKQDFAQNTDQALWQQVVAGERLTAAKKHSDPVVFDPFDLPGMMAANENLGFHDNSDSVARRMISWYWGNSVTQVDGDMPRKLLLEMGGIICLCNRIYLRKVHSVDGDRIWNHLPPYFHDMKAENAEQTNALIHFLANAPITYSETAYIHQTEFTRIYKQHCKDNDLVHRSLRRDYYAGPFRARGMQVVRGMRPDPSNPERQMKGPWIEGMKMDNAHA